MHSRLKIIINITLRGLVLGSRFSLIFILAKYLEPSELGLYGLVIATVSYSIYPLGFEFYTFSSRKIVKSPANERRWIIRNQLSLHLVLYLIVLPLLSGIFYFNLLPSDLILIFYLLVILEHVNQESMRILIALQHQLSAGLALFMRQGAWALIVAILMVLSPEYRTLKCALFAWCAGGCAALLLSTVKLWKILPKGECENKVDWSWVKIGLKTALPLFMASLCTNFLSIADRYWFEYLNGSNALGAYVFYVSMATTVVTFMDAGIFSFAYPKLLANNAAKKYSKFNDVVKSMTIQVSAVAVLAIVLGLTTPQWIFSLMGKSIYTNQIQVFNILLIAVVTQCFAYIPHYILYAIEKDRHIIISSIMSVLVFFILTPIFAKYNTFLAVPLALCCVNATALIYKTFWILNR